MDVGEQADAQSGERRRQAGDRHDRVRDRRARGARTTKPYAPVPDSAPTPAASSALEDRAASDGHRLV